MLEDRYSLYPNVELDVFEKKPRNDLTVHTNDENLIEFESLRSIRLDISMTLLYECPY